MSFMSKGSMCCHPRRHIAGVLVEQQRGVVCDNAVAFKGSSVLNIPKQGVACNLCVISFMAGLSQLQKMWAAT